MALSRIKTWNAAETLTASDLNAEFNSICNHFGSLDNDDIDSTATYTMGELIVGSGITSADGGQLHVHTATAGTIQASADADEAVFENSGASGVTILSGATSTGNIAFGDSGDADNGLLKYTHGSTPTLGITVNATAVQSIAAAATTLAHDLAVYQDANNADSQIALGTSATEALFVEALNGGSNKTLEELRFTTKTASGTAHHGKMSFYVDEVNIGNINDAGITLESGKIFAGNITGNVTGNTSGTAATVTSGTQAAITATANLVTVGTIGTGVWQGTAVASAYLDADTAHLSTTQTFSGAKTFSAAAQFSNTLSVGVNGTGYNVQLFGDTAGSSVLWDQSEDDLVLTNAGLAVGSDATGDVYFRNASGFLARLGVGSDGQVLTSTGTLPNWEAAASSGISWDGSTANGVATFKDSDEATVEANLTFDGSVLTVTGDTTISADLMIGLTSISTVGGVATYKSEIASSAGAQMLISEWGNDNVAGSLSFSKSRSASMAASRLTVNGGDDIGKVTFYADDGGGIENKVVEILAEMDQTSGAGDLPGRLTFWTATDGSTTLVERMRIDSLGQIGIGGAPNAKLDVYKSGGGTADVVTQIAGSTSTGTFTNSFGNTSNRATAVIGTAYTSGEGILNCESAGNSRLFVTAAGNVGIGTTAPSTDLEVRGPASDFGTLTLSTAETTIVNTDPLGRIDFRAPLEGSGSNAVLTTARIEARATETFDATHNQTNLLFMTANDGGVTTKMQIASTGFIGMGADATYGGTFVPAGLLDMRASTAGQWACHMRQQSSGANYGLSIEFPNSSNDNQTAMFLQCQEGATVRTQIFSDGDVKTADSGILTSDQRLKTNIVDASDKLADVMRLQVRNFEWTPEYHPAKVGEKKIGFIAQELETVFPALVKDYDIAADNSIEEELYGADDDTQYYVDGDEIPDGKDVGDVKTESQIPDDKAIGDVKVAAKDHEPTMRKSYKDAFTPILVKALQEVTTRLEAAEAKITALESA